MIYDQSHEVVYFVVTHDWQNHGKTPFCGQIQFSVIERLVPKPAKRGIRTEKLELLFPRSIGTADS